MTTYTVKRNGKVYTYDYDRKRYGNNSAEYNKEYWEKNKEEIKKKSKLRRVDKKLDEFQERVEYAKRNKLSGDKSSDSVKKGNGKNPGDETKKT